VLRAHLYEDRKAEAEASLGLNEAQKRETLELMDATSPATRAEDCGGDRAACEMSWRASRRGGGCRRCARRCICLHGEADNIIPSAETLWMASELPREDLKAMLVSPVLSHLDLDGAQPGRWIGGGWCIFFGFDTGGGGAEIEARRLRHPRHWI